MTEIPTCKKCQRQCCVNGRPMVTPQELYAIEKKLNIKIPTYIDEDLVHLPEIPAYGSHIRIKPTCPMLGENGCILSHDERPVICRLAPWVPHLFREPDSWELLLDVARCKDLSHEWIKTYNEAKTEFMKILKENPNWQRY